ncbi:putative late blight resistance protein homolog R1C-3 [Salvia miltiorrhiza]|uniref:putative late blight resistance protein homolog R1C-3 n=1 Tax=Salvia miltiorrhiza TaxID=226208 RepID=UPI0025AC6BDC|nr:putative late blight resistance protein homolog R1C-3 [Salvia miltiorrhiza]
MTTYGAIISLKNTIQYILHSSHIISLLDPSLHITQLAYKELQPFQEILEKLDNTSKSSSRKKVNALDGRIKEALWKFEDLLESIHSDLQSPLDRLRDDVDSFIHTLKDMEREYLYELQNMLEDDDEPISSIIGFGGRKSKMIGLSYQIEQVKSDVMQEYNWKHVYALVGMAGVGKTTLAKEIFEDPQISSHFECRAWVTVGRKPQLTQLLQGILAQLCGITQGDDIIGDYLKGKKCLIVVDDVWETHVLNSLISSLPDIENGVILILVTARERNVIANIVCSGFYDVVRFLNDEESKDLLCKKVFGEEICPPQLDKAATKIAKNCEGLPLLIVTVAHHLSKSHNRDPKYWNDVAEKRNSVFTDAYDEISKVWLDRRIGEVRYHVVHPGIYNFKGCIIELSHESKISDLHILDY